MLSPALVTIDKFNLNLSPGYPQNIHLTTSAELINWRSCELFNEKWIDETQKSTRNSKRISWVFFRSFWIEFYAQCYVKKSAAHISDFKIFLQTNPPARFSFIFHNWKVIFILKLDGAFGNWRSRIAYFDFHDVTFCGTRII